jgi:hypothetical protein
MKPEETIENLIRENAMETRPLWLEQTKTEMLNTFQQSQTTKTPAESIWRIIMNSRMTQIAAAAVIIAGVFVGIYLFDNTGQVVWANVIRPVIESTRVEYDAVVDETGKHPQHFHDVVVGSRVLRSYASGPVKEAIIDTENQMLFVLVPEEKTAVSIRIKNLPEKMNLISRLRNILIELQSDPAFKVQEIGSDTIDGRPAVGFLASHPQKKLMVWADPKTSLPIRIDVNDEWTSDVVCRNFRFDVEVSQELMEMEVPQGYAHEEHTLDLAGLPEADLIESLRFYAESNGGLFPEDVSVLHCIQPGENIRKRIETLGRNDQEALRIMMQIIRQFLLLQYYKGPGQWHWTGTGVKLGDAQTPIYWYQPMNSSAYRVIYGDLHAEDSTENDLPKITATDLQTEIMQASEQLRERTFIGNEEDRWHILGDGTVEAHSAITLTAVSSETNRMYINLPYLSSAVKSVTCGGQMISFTEITPGRYELKLPDSVMTEKQAIECIWTVSLDNLKKEDVSGYIARCRSLIPVKNFSLTFVLSPNCGFENTMDPVQREIMGLNVTSSGRVRMDIGYCGIPIQAAN